LDPRHGYLAAPGGCQRLHLSGVRQGSHCISLWACGFP
jgi:hypothetical protein